jgi:hypothetical protein
VIRDLKLLTVLNIEIVVFADVTLCSTMVGDQYLKGTGCFHLLGRREGPEAIDVIISLPNYTASHTGRP